MKKVVAFDLNDYGAILLRGQLEVQNKNKTEGKKMVVSGFEKINTIGTDVQFGDLTESQQYYLRLSLMEYAKFQLEKDPYGAKKTISIGHQYFYEDREDCLLDDNSKFKELYDEITG